MCIARERGTIVIRRAAHRDEAVGVAEVKLAVIGVGANRRMINSVNRGI